MNLYTSLKCFVVPVFPVWSYLSGLFLFLFAISVCISFYILWHINEVRLKIIFLGSFWVVLFLLFFFNYELIYAFKLDELLDERALIRDPQEFVRFLYYQASFWATVLIWPVFLYTLVTYFYTGIYFRVIDNIKIFIFLIFILQILCFISVYRWVYPAWLLSISNEGFTDGFYAFEPDRYRIAQGFFIEFLDLLIFAFFFNFAFCLSLTNLIRFSWKIDRIVLLIIFYLFLFLVFYYGTLTLLQFILFFLIFDLVGFRFYLILRLNSWKGLSFKNNLK